ncbi:MAG TPA: hypothetical protein VFK13_10450 [Gemmatimonadaceae bacterium]|nr:hypothetical protein [Gemmatimonadaceae bacterium]
MLGITTRRLLPALALLAVVATACRGNDGGAMNTGGSAPDVHDRLAQYTTVRLTTDLGTLSEHERQMLPLLIDAAREMDPIFWQQAYGNGDSLLAAIDDSATRRYAEINYGPWDRLHGDEPFLAGVGAKPAGANFYPRGMTREEFDSAAAASSDSGAALRSLYTLVRRDSAGKLTTTPYHVAYAAANDSAAASLRAAARLADDPALRHYLELRAQALLSDDYRASDLAWMDMKNNTLDIVIGPIETYEDALFGYKAANEAYVLVKDKDWSRRLARYISFLPSLQKGLPVPAAYKPQLPGTSSDLNAYDVVYYAGQANAGAKTIAINLPNDETVQRDKGTRRLQLKNAMRAKFDKILIPIVNVLIGQDQRQDVKFDAFFANTMFHEVAHGLGIKNTINGKGTVRAALRDQASALEEEKADVLGLYMIDTLHARGDLPEADIRSNYITFLAGILRSVRFGASDAHGKANMATFNFLQQRGAFTRDSAAGTYSVNVDKMRTALTALAEKILRLQGDGDYQGVSAFYQELGRIPPELQADLDRLSTAGIPVDILFEQGMSVLTPESASESASAQPAAGGGGR